ncbi:MAG: hypothetical protein L0Z54_04130 [Thermoplasmata archaeon]|nr:hypothetical protein [Thermoplasmata archaeon]
MKQASVAVWTSVLAAGVSAVVLVLMLDRGLAEPAPGETLSLDPLGWGVLVAAIACLSVSLAMAAYAEFLKRAVEHASAPAGPTPSDEAQEQPSQEEGEAGPDLGRLTEDERRLYEIIEAAGGEVLQMKLVSSGEFSKSKVTRLLDKLEDRDLIKRERHGMTNMVRLSKGE